MRDDSQVNRATAFRLCVCLLAGIALACGDDSEAVSTTSTEGADSPTASAPSASPAPAASELYVDADGTVEPTGAMDELIALACGDGPVPDDLEIVFYEGSPDTGARSDEPERGVYAGNRVVHYLPTQWTFDRSLVDLQMARRVHALSSSGKSPVNTQLRLRVIGSLPNSVLRELWCDTARDLSRLGVPSGGPECAAPAGMVGIPSIRISTQGRAWHRRTRVAAACAFDSFMSAHSRFDRRITSALFRGRPPYRLPIDLVELRARATDECTLPRTDFALDLVLDERGQPLEIRADDSALSRDAVHCVSSIVRRGDFSRVLEGRDTNAFSVESLVVGLGWVDGYPVDDEAPLED